ncbi:MAG: hypothetical protein ABSG53_26925 [Thermoguttaceae bacterium]|jgi:hypothetical protein
MSKIGDGGKGNPHRQQEQECMREIVLSASMPVNVNRGIEKNSVCLSSSWANWEARAANYQVQG